MSKNLKWTLDRLADLIISVKDEVTEVKTRVGNVETEVKEVKTRLHSVETEVKEVKTRLDKVESRLDNVETKIVETNQRIDYYHKVPVGPPPTKDPNYCVLKKAVTYKILEFTNADELIDKLNWIETEMKKDKCNAIHFLIRTAIFEKVIPIIKASRFVTRYNVSFENIDMLV